MKLINKSPRNYIAFDVVLKAGEIIEVNDSKTANILKTQPEVEEYIDVEEIKKIKEENEKLKEEKAEAKKSKAKAKK